MKKRIISFVLSLLLVIGLIPMTGLAADSYEGEVRVIISNDTYSVDEGAPWEGDLVDEWVSIDESSTVMSCIVAALDNNGYEQEGAENNYISSINGLAEFDGGGMSGWMGTLNDWFTDCGFGDFSVAAGNFGDGDEIHVMYSLSYGEDLGGSWANSDTRIDSILFSDGVLDKEFDPDYTADFGDYTLTLPTGTTEINVQPTAVNKNYMVRIFLNDFEDGSETHYGDYEFKRNDMIPVQNGDIIYVGCGCERWPSMNTSDGGQVYAFNVVIPEPEPEQPLDYKTVLADTLDQIAMTVSEPSFGTSAGEWSVLALARGGYYSLDDEYFAGYYDRVAETVKTTADSVNLSGALHKNKSTENSRVIIALSAIGRDATDVNGVDLVEAYSKNGFNWIKKQGINGPIFALLALDTIGYEPSDDTLRAQCVEFILSKELANGGWALSGTAADPDITSMALQALAAYGNNENVANAAGRAIDRLSAMQKDDGSFASWGSSNSESIAQVITALSAWGIDAGTDERFVKNGRSAIDGLLDYYIEEGRGFAHVLQSGGGYNGGEVNYMATDQAAYALVAYDRFINGNNSLYDMTDVMTWEDIHKSWTGEWVKNSKGWWFSCSDGSYLADGLYEIDGVNYAFNDKGYMVTGWYKDADGDWYHFASSGAMEYGWLKAGGKWYYLDPDSGIMLTGLQDIEGAAYYMNSSGAMLTGWQSIEGDWYFFSKSGAMVKAAWEGDYYLAADGKMVKSAYIRNGAKYYWVNKDGKYTKTYKESDTPGYTIYDQATGSKLS